MLLKVFISLCELPVWFYMPIFGVSNSVPYVPRLFLICSRTSHNELQLKLFCGVQKKTPHLSAVSHGEALQPSTNEARYLPGLLRTNFLT